MNGPFSGKVQRVSLGFSVEGLGARDEVLLKSLVRLLDHRTLHQWHHQPPGEGGRCVCWAKVWPCPQGLTEVCCWPWGGSRLPRRCLSCVCLCMPMHWN